MIKPQDGPQEQFLSSPADIVFYGGAAGGGKSWALLVEPLRHVLTTPGFNAVYFRRTSKQITSAGSAWDETFNIYPHLGGRERNGFLDWHFPPYKNRLAFSHMEYEKNRLDWKSAQIALILFDQLEDFTRKMFFYMLSRNRSTSGIRPYVRAGYNPVPDDDPIGGWIHEFITWYLDENGQYPDPNKAGVIRWFVNIDDSLQWYASEAAAAVDWPDIPAKSFTFIPAAVTDNAILLATDPGYLANLYALGHVDQQRLLKGDHKVREAAGKVFNKSWFKMLEIVPKHYDVIIRFWDKAATAKKVASGAATASVKLGIEDGRIYILDVTEDWLGPAEIDDHIVGIAAQDGRGVIVRWEEEGGASGKMVSYDLVSKLAGYDAGGIRPQGDKLARSKPLAAQARVGNVYVLSGPWAQNFLTHMHNVPDGGRMDIHDAAAGAYNEVAIPVPQTAIQAMTETVAISPY